MAEGLHVSGDAQQWGCTAVGLHVSGAAWQGGCKAVGIHSSGAAQQFGVTAASSKRPDAYLNFQVVVISAVVALPQVLLVEHHTVHWLPWTLHIAAQKQTES